jgi:8-oxo-dGTP pyrophosphatase MutT (NUDIX family)
MSRESVVLEHLDDELRFAAITMRFEFGFCPPPHEEVSSVHLVPFVGDDAVVVRLEDGHWMMPGGTLEPGEQWEEAAERELLEEAGARVLDMTPFGVMRAHAAGPQRWREHLPWPDFCWVIGAAEVELVGPPTQPEGGERIAEVVCLPVEQAAELLGNNDLPITGDMYRLAAAVRANACARPAA